VPAARRTIWPRPGCHRRPVCALVAGGGYAELCVAPAGQCLPVPAGLSERWSRRPACPRPSSPSGRTSSIARLQPGETLLVQGGSSGIGVTAIQLAKALGATVIVTAGSDDKCAACVALGADHAINYRTQDFVAEVEAPDRRPGVDVVLDMVAGDYVGREVELPGRRRPAGHHRRAGRYQERRSTAALVLRKRLVISGSTLRPRSVAYKTGLARALRARVWPLLEAAASSR
jgi:NADPH2:quinone reductase